jgi:sterol desaturase/sphingolipid hydroxylase (fatty acid hydroxylase superfamily)
MDDNPPTARQGAHLSLKTTEPQSFGHGWISGVFAVVLGILGLGAVLCFHYPEWLTMPQLRGRYPLPYVRALVHVVLVAAYLLGTASVWLRRNKALGLTGIALVLIAALLGGSRVPIDRDVPAGGLFGLDWFLLNLILFSVVYIPLERLFAKHPQQPVFRKGWRTDLTYFFLSNLLVQVTTILTLGPAMVFFDWARNARMVSWVSSAPMLLQCVGAILVADLTQYWVHRAFHASPFLWRFHAIHHSAEAMDWLAGSRLHLVDAIVTRGLTYVPIYVLGFSQSAIVVYVVVVVVQATFIHANVRWEFRAVRGLVATPCFHHWHHAAERDAIDKNFAVHSPIWDRLFGTYYLPDRWPAQYGLAGDEHIPSGWLSQFVFPFRRRPVVTESDATAGR